MFAEARKLVRKYVIAYSYKYGNNYKKIYANNPELYRADKDIYYAVYNLIATLTPRQFMNIFQIDKCYDGVKYGMKDYFSTMETINEIGIDTIIGKNVVKFLWEYTNFEVERFALFEFTFTDVERYLDGKVDFSTEFLNDYLNAPIFDNTTKLFSLDEIINNL